MPTYYIHNNGGRPFKVTVARNRLSIYRQVGYDEAKRKALYETSPIVSFSMRGKKLFVPRAHSKTPSYYVSPSTRFGKGNSLLVKLAPHVYMYIGAVVYIFETKDNIRAFYSPIGNNDVPYSWAVGTDYVYLLVEDSVFPRSVFGSNLGDPYGMIYGNIMGEEMPRFALLPVLDSVHDYSTMMPSPVPRCYTYNRTDNTCKVRQKRLPSAFLSYISE